LNPYRFPYSQVVSIFIPRVTFALLAALREIGLLTRVECQIGAVFAIITVSRQGAKVAKNDQQVIDL
jgi:hypothetical protein